MPHPHGEAHRTLQQQVQRLLAVHQVRHCGVVAGWCEEVFAVRVAPQFHEALWLVVKTEPCGLAQDPPQREELDLGVVTVKGFDWTAESGTEITASVSASSWATRVPMARRWWHHPGHGRGGECP